MIEASQWTLKKTFGEVTWHVEKASNNVYPRHSLETDSKMLFCVAQRCDTILRILQ